MEFSKTVNQGGFLIQVSNHGRPTCIWEDCEYGNHKDTMAKLNNTKYRHCWIFSLHYRHLTIGMKICRVFHVHSLDLIRETVPGKTGNKIFLERCTFTMCTNVHSHLSAMSGLRHLSSVPFLHGQFCCLPRPHNWDILKDDTLRKLEMLRLNKNLQKVKWRGVTIVFRLFRYCNTTAVKLEWWWIWGH